MGRRAGMTLIELVVSLALLGMLAVLASLMWSQLRGWDEDAASASAALRPERVRMMLDRQWAARAGEKDDEGAYGRVRGDATTLTFVTRRGVVHPGWPMVEAEYRVEPVDPARPGGGLAVRYEERRLGPYLETVAGDVSRAALVLLGGCESASVRYRAGVTREVDGESVYEERWVETFAASEAEEIEPLYVEFRAVSGGEEVAWVGIVEPLR